MWISNFVGLTEVFFFFFFSCQFAHTCISRDETLMLLRKNMPAFAVRFKRTGVADFEVSREVSTYTESVQSSMLWWRANCHVQNNFLLLQQCNASPQFTSYLLRGKWTQLCTKFLNSRFSPITAAVPDMKIIANRLTLPQAFASWISALIAWLWGSTMYIVFHNHDKIRKTCIAKCFMPISCTTFRFISNPASCCCVLTGVTIISIALRSAVHEGNVVNPCLPSCPITASSNGFTRWPKW